MRITTTIAAAAAAAAAGAGAGLEAGAETTQSDKIIERTHTKEIIDKKKWGTFTPFHTLLKAAILGGFCLVDGLKQACIHWMKINRN